MIGRIVLLALTLCAADCGSGSDAGASGHPIDAPRRRAPSASAVPPSPAGQPRLDRLELVTDRAFGDESQYVPNSWGVHKSRFVRLGSGALFTAYISAGTHDNRAWHLLERGPAAADSWLEVQSGNAGAEPINLLRGPNDEVHLFGWPGTNARLEHVWSTDGGQAFQREDVPGQWYVDQGYGGAAINAGGDMVVYQGGLDDQNPDAFLWAFYGADTQQWSFIAGEPIDYRYTYPFFFLGDGRALDVVAMRDVHRRVLGYPSAPDGQFDYLFDALKVFHTNDVTTSAMSETLVAQQSLSTPDSSDYDLTYLSDSYIDTQGAIHILYNNQYDGPHHAIVVDGTLVNDVRIAVSAGNKQRLIQDSLGHFYVVAIDDGGMTLNVYPGTANDTDGTDLGPVVQLDVSSLAGCSDDDFCHAPTFAVPRNGHPLSDQLDGTYGNHNREIYFRIVLR